MIREDKVHALAHRLMVLVVALMVDETILVIKVRLSNGYTDTRN
jgi:hypothetical protein